MENKQLWGLPGKNISDYDNGNFNPDESWRQPIIPAHFMYHAVPTCTQPPMAVLPWVTTNKGWGSSSISYIAVHPLDPMHLLIASHHPFMRSIDGCLGPTSVPDCRRVPYCAAWENTGKNGIYVGGFDL
ncbi:MAG: hypothetical protein R2778_03150 [Saprospiraceae bacterium]